MYNAGERVIVSGAYPEAHLWGKHGTVITATDMGKYSDPEFGKTLYMVEIDDLGIPYFHIFDFELTPECGRELTSCPDGG